MADGKWRLVGVEDCIGQVGTGCVAEVEVGAGEVCVAGAVYYQDVI